MTASQHTNVRPREITERQLRNWAIAEQSAQRALNRAEPGASGAKRISFLAISREAGAGGAVIAREVGERIGWPVYDANLLDQVAKRHQESRTMLDLVDETPGNWVFDTWGGWLDRHIISHDKYLAQVGRMIRRLARSGNAVFVGRGSQFILPRAKTFAVRFVAPEIFRSHAIEQIHGKGLKEALAWIRRTDRGRQEFVERFFHHDIGDPHLYDLVVNVGTLGVSGAVEQVLHAMGHSQSA